MAARMATLAQVARAAGVTPPTVRLWVEKGWLREGGPWTARQVELAATKGRQAGGRGTLAPHGTPSRWRAGCPCDECRAAHYDDLTRRRNERAAQRWADLEPLLLDALAAGTPYGEALEQVGVTAQAVTRHRRRDPGFADRVDDALMKGRDPRLEHGTLGAWKARCRCPECRARHEESRAAA